MADEMSFQRGEIRPETWREDLRSQIEAASMGRIQTKADRIRAEVYKDLACTLVQFHIDLMASGEEGAADYFLSHDIPGQVATAVSAATSAILGNDGQGALPVALRVIAVNLSTILTRLSAEAVKALTMGETPPDPSQVN